MRERAHELTNARSYDMIENKKIKTALITGASSGIGSALAHELAEHGYNLILMARRAELLQQLKTDIQNKHSSAKVVVVASDVSDYEKHMNDVRDASKEFTSLDLVIANAGVGYTTDESKNCWEKNKKTFDVNVLGALATLEVAKDIMLKQGHGHLAGVTSMAAFRGIPLSSSYSGSKAGLGIFLESMRLDLLKSNIVVTAIHPGFVETPMTKNNGRMPWLMPAEKAARIIFNGLQKKKARILFPWQMMLLMMFLRRMPNAMYDFLLARFVETARVFRKNRE